MEKIYIRYKVHPGDLLRNSDFIELPDPNDNTDNFLVWFLHNYQSDYRIAYLDDLNKLLFNEFSSDKDRSDFIEEAGNKTDIEIQEEIDLIYKELEVEAYKNFYHLLLSNKIEVIVSNGKKELDKRPNNSCVEPLLQDSF